MKLSNMLLKLLHHIVHVKPNERFKLLNNKDILFKLIEQSLSNKKYQFESLDELELTKFIFENGLVGLVYHAIDPSSLKIPKYYQMLSQAFGSFVSKDVQQQAIITQVKDSF